MNIKRYAQLLSLTCYAFSSGTLAAESHHAADHGGQIHFSNELEQQWLFNRAQETSYGLAWKSRIGTDEQQLKLALELERPESESSHFSTQLLYSQMLSDFWNVDIGAGYIEEQFHDASSKQTDKRWQALLGVQGLAVYFIETEAYITLAADQFYALNLQVEREFLFTQRWHLSPFIDLEYVLQDKGRYAKATGLSTWSIGSDLRYEWNKQVVPFVRVQYREQAERVAFSSINREHAQGMLYGAGLSLSF